MTRIFYPTPEQWEQLIDMIGGEEGIVIVSPSAQQELRERLGQDPPGWLDDYDWSDADLWIDWVSGPDSWGYEQLLGAGEDEENEEESQGDQPASPDQPGNSEATKPGLTEDDFFGTLKRLGKSDNG
jgi:hypothetical protein